MDDPQDKILWEGEIGSATFSVEVPSDCQDGSKKGVARIYADELQIARIHFVIAVGIKSLKADQIPIDEHRHRTAFASYASEDRDAVLARIQGIQKVAPDLDVFLDVLNLRSGENWEKRLWKEIPARDVFYLFWSEFASRSEWVEKQWMCALKERGLDFVDPVPLVSPHNVPPPRELASKHFELQNRPTYFPERFSIVSWIADIRERIGSVNTSALLVTYLVRLPGRAMARTRLRMMLTFPSLPLKVGLPTAFGSH